MDQERQRRQSKSFHTIDDTNIIRRMRRDRSSERRRISLEEDNRKRNNSLERRRYDPHYNNIEEFVSLEQQQQQQTQRRTVIHACDDKTGKCLFHPHVILRKKALFGMLGGWVDVLRSCPECESEDLKRLNSEGNARGVGYASPGVGGGKLPQPKERRRRRTLSPVDRRERTLSPNPNRRAANTESDKSRRDRTLSPKRRDRTLSPLDRSKRDISPRRRDRTLSPVDKRRDRDRTLSPIDKRNERVQRRGKREYQAPPPLKRNPKQRSRTLSPIDRSRQRLGAFKKKKEEGDEDSMSEEEDRRKQTRKNSCGNNPKRYDEDEHAHSYSEEIKRKKKKNALRGRRRKESFDVPPPNPNDFISSYLTTGAVPNSNDRVRKTKRKGSLGGLKNSGNSMPDWKNLSANVATDVAEKGMKLAEKVMRKKNRKKVVQSTDSLGFSDDEMNYLKQNFIYDVDVDEKDDSFDMHVKSHDDMFIYSMGEYSKSHPEILPSKSSRRRSRKIDLSDRTGDTDMNMSWQTPRRREEDAVPQSPPKKVAEYVHDEPLLPKQKEKQSQDKYSYEKSWSADGIRVRAATANDDGYDNYIKSSSMDGGIRVVASDDVSEVQQSQVEKEPSQQCDAEVDKSSQSYYEEQRTSHTNSQSQEQSHPDQDRKASDTSYTEETAHQTTSSSRDKNSSDAFNMDTLKSAMHEYIAKHPSADIADEGPSLQHHATATVPGKLEPINSQSEERSHPDQDRKASAASYTKETAHQTTSSSRDKNSSDAFNMDTLKSAMHEYIAKHPPADIADERPSLQHHATATVPGKLEPINVTHAAGETHNNEDETNVSDLEQHSIGDSSSESDVPAPFPTKPEALPRVMSLGNLTIDLSALQATRPAKPDVKSVEVKQPAAKPSGNATVDNSSVSGSEESIKIDRSALQRARPKRDPDEETVRTFATTNLPWTGRFGESGMYTGYVNEQYQPHGRGTMMFDHGEIKKGHWKHGDFVRESGPYSDSEDDDSDDDEEEGDLSSSMMNVSTNIRSRSRSRDRPEPQLTSPLTPTYKIGSIADKDDMIHDIDVIKELIPKLGVEDGAFIRRSDGKWTYAIVKLIEATDGKRAIRFTVNEKNSSKSYAEKYWFTHIRPIKVTTQKNAGEPKKSDPAGIISRQSSVAANSEKEEESDNRGTYCPPVQSRLFGARGRSRSRSRARRGASLTPMRTLCSIDESDMEDDDSDEEEDSFGESKKVEVTGLHTMARTTYALRGIDP